MKIADLTAEERTMIKMLWLTMIVKFPNLWISQNGELSEGSNLCVGSASWLSDLRINKITSELVQNGFNQMSKTYPSLPKEKQSFPPNSYEFIAFCLKRDDVPCLSEIMPLIALSARIQGSVAEQFKHPLAYAIAKDKCFDITRSQCSATAFERYLKPFYDKHKSTYPDFLPEHYPIALPPPEERKIALPDFVKKIMADVRNIKIEPMKPTFSIPKRLNLAEVEMELAEHYKRIEQSKKGMS